MPKPEEKILLESDKLARYQALVKKNSDTSSVLIDLYANLGLEAEFIEKKGPLYLNMKTLWPEAYQPKTVCEAYHKILGQNGIIVRIPSDYNQNTPIPITADTSTPAPFLQTIVHVKSGASISMIEACTGAKNPDSGIRAPGLTILLEKNAAATLYTYQDSITVKENIGLRRFFLRENAKLAVKEVLIGSIQNPPQTSYSCSAESSLNIDTISIKAKNKNQKNTCAIKGNPKTRISITEIGPNGNNLEWHGPKINERIHINPHALSKEEVEFCHKMGLTPETSRQLKIENALEQHISDIPMEYKVEIIAAAIL